MAKISLLQIKVEEIYDSLENLVITIDNNISEDNIKKSYRLLARKYHPDYYKGTDGSQIFNIIQKSYDFLMGNKDFIKKNLNLIIKYDEFLKKEEYKLNPDKNSKSLLRAIERKRILEIRVKTAANVEQKVKIWLDREINWLEEDKVEWEEIYLPILKNSVANIDKELNTKINLLKDKIDSCGNDIVKQKKYKEDLEIEIETRDLFLDNVKAQIVIKNNEFAEKGKKLKELEFISNDINIGGEYIFYYFYDFYDSLICEYDRMFEIEDIQNNCKIVSELTDEKLNINNQRS